MPILEVSLVIVIVTIASYWMVNRLFLSKKAKYKAKEAIREVGKSCGICYLLDNMSDASLFIKKYIEYLEDVRHADYHWVMHQKSSLDFSLEVAKRQQLNNLLKKHFKELKDVVEDNTCRECDISNLEKTIEAGKDEVDISMYEEEILRLKKKGWQQITERSIRKIYKDLQGRMIGFSGILGEIKCSKKSGNDVSSMGKRIKEIKNFLAENKKKIKEMQK
ncbi:MAG: hypothetical protein KAS07_02930 [Candidatus Pacebacteria bacterium]|nr:hypothetical protein [Candidatus Paceibacterota bacterium]